MKEMIINETLKTENFSRSYPALNKYFVENADFQDSRNGATKEFLDFKTQLTNPYKRCVGNNGRNINIFFLLAEAMWIFAGKKDLATLEIFNSQMKEYSDDGINFHAPYGFRIRHHGISSFDKAKPSGENKHAVSHFLGKDQMFDALQEFENNPDSRQVVLQIWDANLDLGAKTKDKPCNDLLLFKIRKGKFITTIANRSNDLHWGLPTNIFQFSFVSEMMSLVLGKELGTQTLNSQSLHFYTDNDIALRMYENSQLVPNYKDLYDFSVAKRITYDFDKVFNCKTVFQKLDAIDTTFEQILESFVNQKPLSFESRANLRVISPEILLYHDLCHIFIAYKNSPKTDDERRNRIEEIYNLSKQFYNPETDTPYDVVVLAQNFFRSRITDGDYTSFILVDESL